MATDDAGRPTPQHFIRLEDLSRDQVNDLLDLAQRLKSKQSHGTLTGKSVGMLFFRGSLRTRVSLEAAMHQLGGRTVELTAASDAWELETREGTVMDGRAPEHVRDAAAVLSSYVDALAVRPAPVGQSWDADRRDDQIASWAKHARVPVINMDSVQWHPLQALADVMTLRETFGKPKGRKLALVWVASPRPASVSVAHSLLLAALGEGLDVSVAHPPGFELDQGVLDTAQTRAGEQGTKLEITGDMESAMRGAHVVYARSWQSLADYGNPTLGANRRGRFSDWIVDDRRMGLGDEAHLMHAMPVRRNVEVADSVLDSSKSLVYTQAANRLHAQKALLSFLLR